MIRKAFLMTLKPGNEIEYKRRHNPVWPEMQAILKKHGALNYAIFRRGMDLFAYAEIESEERWNALANTDIVKKWWASMAPLMETNADLSPVSADLELVFSLNEQAQK